MLSMRTKLNTFELITLRFGFSIYSGWVTTATILNIAVFLKFVDFGGEYEPIYAVGILWVALPIYWAFTIIERNPLYGAVFIWVLYAIYVKQNKNAELFEINSIILMSLHSSFIIIYSIYYLFFYASIKS
jgi:hypothetical protein